MAEASLTAGIRNATERIVEEELKRLGIHRNGETGNRGNEEN
jgi:hypothetical protein